MDPQNPTIPTPPPQVTPPAISPVFPKKNNLVAISLSILLLVTLSATVYLFLRVQSLTKQLTQLQVQPTPTPFLETLPANPTAEQYCAGPNNLPCPSGYACKLNIVYDTASGGKCVNESETNP